MEVHHHAHTPRRKWSHYFWEFLMLFLAVFCGFLAEYQLEHKIEKQRANQYIHSFYEDLQNDTMELHRIMDLDEKKMAGIQTLFDCYQKWKKQESSFPCLQNLLWNSFAFPDLIYSERTLQQLKNAGGMRLLKKEDADSILSYDHLLRRYQRHEMSLLQNMQNNLRNTYIELINFEALQYIGSPSPPEDVPFFFPADKEKINKLFTEIFMYGQSFTIGRSPLLVEMLKRARLQLKYFREKYGLEN